MNPNELISRIATLNDEEAIKAAVELVREIYGDELDLPPIWRTDLLDGRGHHIEKPPDFDDFVTKREFMGQPGLFPRQEEFLRHGMDFDPDRLFSRRKSLHTMIALYGKGCLGKDEQLKDFRSGLTKTVEEWKKDGRALLLPSWDGQKVLLQETSPVYKKGEEVLYKVELNDGRSFTTAGKHKCLTANGWKPIDEITLPDAILSQVPSPASRQFSNHQMPFQRLCMKDVAVLNLRALQGDPDYLQVPESNAKFRWANGEFVLAFYALSSHDDSLSVHAKSALNEIHTIGDSEFDYHLLSRFYDEQLPPVLSSDLNAFPLQGDAHERSYLNFYMGDCDTIPIRNRIYQLCDHQKEETFQPHNHDDAFLHSSILSGGESSLHSHQKQFPIHKLSHLLHNDQRYPSSADFLMNKSFLYSKNINLNVYWASIKSISRFDRVAFYDLSVPGTNCYFDAQGILHHNSGKDFICSLVLAWVCFVICSMADPWTYLNHAPGEPLDVANIATTADQANTVFFNKLKARLKRPCFSQFKPKIGKGNISFFREHPDFTDKLLLLQLHSLHAKAESWEGKSLIFWVMDEADAFEDESGNSNANACYLVLKSSAESRFGKRYLGLIISFRRVKEGFMDRMKKMAEDFPDEYYFDEAATWDVRTDKTKEDFKQHYEIDPIDARMKYENIAPEAVDAFITNPERVDHCVDHQRLPVATVTPFISSVRNPGTGMEQQYVALQLDDIKGNLDKTYFIHGDPGHSDASFAICLMHVETGSAVARGFDNDTEDEYAGDVLSANEKPIADATVIYFDKDNVEKARVSTDKLGRHSVWLRTGQYSYAFYDKYGQLIRHETGLNVSAGTELVVGTNEQHEMVGDDPSQKTVLEKRMVYPVVEDLILEWKPVPGESPVDYNNVEKVLLELCRNFNVMQVTFDKWNSIQIIQNLQANGVNASDMSFSQQQQFGIYSNFRMLINEGLVSLLGGPEKSVPWRANRQLKKLRNLNNRKIEPPSGEWKDLADARATAAFYACTYDSEVIVEDVNPEDIIFSPM